MLRESSLHDYRIFVKHIRANLIQSNLFIPVPLQCLWWVQRPLSSAHWVLVFSDLWLAEERSPGLLIGWAWHSGHNHLLCSHFWSYWEYLNCCSYWCYCCCRSRLRPICHINCISSSSRHFYLEQSKKQYLNTNIFNRSQCKNKSLSVSTFNVAHTWNINVFC